MAMDSLSANASAFLGKCQEIDKEWFYASESKAEKGQFVLGVYVKTSSYNALLQRHTNGFGVDRENFQADDFCTWNSEGVTKLDFKGECHRHCSGNNQVVTKWTFKMIVLIVSFLKQ
jgi:hypothetical protein